jgi:hypothetical protein
VSNDAPTIPAEQKSASKNSLAGNRLQKCKHPGGKVPFFHELKSSQKTLPAWVHAQRLHICEKAQGMIFAHFPQISRTGSANFPL